MPLADLQNIMNLLLCTPLGIHLVLESLFNRVKGSRETRVTRACQFAKYKDVLFLCHIATLPLSPQVKHSKIWLFSSIEPKSMHPFMHQHIHALLFTTQPLMLSGRVTTEEQNTSWALCNTWDCWTYPALVYRAAPNRHSYFLGGVRHQECP